MNKMKVESFTTKAGYINAKIIYDDKEISLHSRDPYREADRVFKRFNNSVNWVIIAGAGLMYIPEYILENTKWNIIIYEHDPALIKETSRIRDCHNILNNERIHIFHDPDKLIAFLTRKRINELNFYIHRPYISLFPDIYSSLEGLLITYLSKKQINQATFMRFQKVWLRNIIKNSRYYFDLPGINNIRHTFNNKPAVIIGAGPSLSKNIESLKKHQNKLLIIATDTALPMLLTQSIIPDITVSVDPQNKNAQYLLYTYCQDTTLVMDCTVSHQVFSKSVMKNKLIYDNIFPLYKRMNQFWGTKGKLKAGGSVSTSAFDLARFLKCDPIILIGQDLAFSKKKTHFSGSILEDFLYYRIDRFNTYDNYNTRMLLLSDKIRIKGWEGTPVTTDRKFATFLEWFQREIKDSPQKIINATEGGAFINGAQHLTFEQTIQAYCQQDINKDFRIDFQSHSEEKYLEFLQNLNREIERFITLAHRALISANKSLELFRKNKNIQSVIEDMNKFDSELLSKIKIDTLISDFLEMTMQVSIQRILDQAHETAINETTLENWVCIYKEAFEGLCFIQRILTKRLSMK